MSVQIRQTRELHERQIDVLDTLAKRPHLSAKEIADDTGTSLSSAYHVLGRCMDDGLIVVNRPQQTSRRAPPGFYTLTDRGREELRIRLRRGAVPGVSGHQASFSLPVVWVGTLKQPIYRRIFALLLQGATTRAQIVDLFDRRRPLPYRTRAAKDKLLRLRESGIVEAHRDGPKATWTLTARGRQIVHELELA